MHGQLGQAKGDGFPSGWQREVSIALLHSIQPNVCLSLEPEIPPYLHTTHRRGRGLVRHPRAVKALLIARLVPVSPVISVIALLVVAFPIIVPNIIYALIQDYPLLSELHGHCTVGFTSLVADNPNEASLYRAAQATKALRGPQGHHYPGRRHPSVSLS